MRLHARGIGLFVSKRIKERPEGLLRVLATLCHRLFLSRFYRSELKQSNKDYLNRKDVTRVMEFKPNQVRR